MKTTPSTRLKISEIAECIEQGWSNTAIIKRFSAQWGVTARSVDRYVALAKDLVNGRLNKREKVVEAVRADIIAHEAETWLRSNMELEAKLCAIVSGKIGFKKSMKKGKETQEVTVYPNCMEVMYAIDLLLKLRGVYRMPVVNNNEPPIIKIAVENKEDQQLIERIWAHTRSFTEPENNKA